MIYNQMLKKLESLEKEISSLEKKLNSFPAGNLLFSHNGNYLKWYQSDGHHQTYIPKKNRKLAEKLAEKKYLSLLYNELLHEKTAIELYLSHHNAISEKANDLLAPTSDYHEFLYPHYTDIAEELSTWKTIPYKHNPLHPEQRVLSTTSGHKVRSKSEALIDMVLYKNNIPFRYEAELLLGESIFYPDFTIRHPHTGKTYYWEHFGMMDIPDYSKKALSKLQRYISFNIIPNIQLITTYETKNTPLSPDLVENLVEYYFS